MSVVVYGIVEPGAKLARGTKGIDGVAPRRIDHGGVAALIGDLERDELVARRRDLQAHMDVLAAALDRSTVIPMQFGALMEGENEVTAELLAPLEDRLRELLDRFENLVELRLSARYDEPVLLSEIVAENPRVRGLRGTPGMELELGELVAGAYERKRRQDAAALMERLRPLVLEDATGEGREWDLLTVSLLVRRVDAPALESEIERWAEQQAGRATVELAGPMPAYSFVELEAPEAAWA